MNPTLHALIPSEWRVFLADKGLSQSEANHKANLIKEKSVSLQALFDGTGAYNAVMSFEEGKQVPLDTYKKVENLQVQALLEGNAYALSSWLREGITAKKELLSYIAKMPVSALDYNSELVTFDEVSPSMDRVDPVKVVTEKDIIGELDIKERAEYLTLEAQASHLGKKIHKNGIISTLHKESKKSKAIGFKELPNGNGLKTYIVNFTPVYDTVQLEKDYFELQEKHRAFEMKLNWYKAQIQNKITTRNAQYQREYADRYSAASTKYQLEMREYNEKANKFSQTLRATQQRLEARRLEFTNYASGLKITIPESLAPVLETLAVE